MKNFLKFLITKLLIFKAKQYLKRHRTQIIAITGSIGKTSTKEAIYHILKKHFKTYRSPCGFNTDIGLSLAILQEEESGFSSITAWLKILQRVLFDVKKPFEKIILEMGADHPGDIKKLIQIAKPKIGVITNINPVHLGKGQFKDLKDIQKEKNMLIKNMESNCMAVLNFDDELVRDMHTGAQKVSYGTSEECSVRASDVEVLNTSIKFKVTYKGEAVHFKVPVLGKFQIYTILPAITVALKLGINLHDCAKILEDYKMPKSRMNPIPGINKSTIIDSSYNSSPTATLRALELLDELKAERKIAALGTMNELGEMTKEAHLTLGGQASKVAKILIAVGPEAVTIKQGATEAGMKEENIYTFFDSEEAGHFLKNEISPKDLILVKGSQNKVRMERLVKLIMEKPGQAGALLCRQGEEWDKI